jgi:LPS export ABC transporter protein LptC
MSLRNLLALLILLSVAALMVVLFFNLPGKRAEDLLAVLPKQVDLALEKVHYTQTEGGRRRWTLDAESADYQRESGLASLQNVEMVLFEVGRFAEVKMTAGEGRFDQQQGWVDIWGNVEIVTDRDEHFYTERLRYDQNSRQVSSDEAICVVSPQLELSGTGLLLDLRAGQMSILQDVHAQFKPASQERSVK